MTMYALVSGRQVMYSDGTKVTVKPKKSNRPRKKSVKVGSKVMVNFNPEFVAIVTKQVGSTWFEFEIIQGKEKGTVSCCDKKLLTVID